MRKAAPEGRSIRRALIVEDEPLVADVIAAVLATRGVATQRLSGLDGLAEALSPPPDLVLLDVSLAGSDAVDIMKTLAAEIFGGDVLLVSGASPALLDDVMRVGRRRGLRMLPALAKPFRSGDLAAILDRPIASDASGRRASPAAEGGDHATFDCAEALRRDLVEVWYQPKCDPRTGAVLGAECLARVRLPGGEILAPGAFLPGTPADAMADLTEFVLGRACRDWVDFAEAGHPVRLAVNVPSSALVDMPLPLLLREHCPKHPDWPGLVLEITEEDACRDADSLYEAGTQMGIYGVQLSVDDFGLGYSNLSRLSQLPFREIKLDRSLVWDCHRNEKRSALCRAVVDLAHACGAIVVAEGVERQEELAHLALLGCDAVQGFVFARPMPAASFRAYLCGEADDLAASRPVLSAA